MTPIDFICMQNIVEEIDLTYGFQSIAMTWKQKSFVE